MTTSRVRFCVACAAPLFDAKARTCGLCGKTQPREAKPTAKKDPNE